MKWQTFVGPPKRRVFHFTKVDNLPAMIQRGALLSDCALRQSGTSFAETGNPAIKQRRRDTPVSVEPGGVVGDYVPFYFAPQSPMLFEVARKAFARFGRVQDQLIYLVTEADMLAARGEVVVTDRNAAKMTAAFSPGVGAIDDLVDWSLMSDQFWRNTLDELDRKERRMAELLVHGSVPLELLTAIVVRTRLTEQLVQRHISGSLLSRIPLCVFPNWYFDETGW
ncbi:DUF4433 domain-containing protein [Kutzneria viridogrisea]|uniref:DarT domain-containing protein n=1 Tax=Kutzneria viridogrisea TaxID=47990 RepID=A0ABR6BQS0_9PSEU|nr:hypothetical protein [Kutzneria viridogrisea]